MKAQQLRIGNIGHFPHLKGNTLYDYDFVNYIDKTSFGYESNTNTMMTIDSFKPIPLNEEWMVKLGFEKYDQMGNNTFWATRDQRFHIKDIDIGIFNGDVKFKFGEIGWDGSINLKYVHQFQNIIYALTGEELTLQK